MSDKSADAALRKGHVDTSKGQRSNASVWVSVSSRTFFRHSDGIGGTCDLSLSSTAVVVAAIDVSRYVSSVDSDLCSELSAATGAI